MASSPHWNQPSGTSTPLMASFDTNAAIGATGTTAATSGGTQPNTSDEANAGGTADDLELPHAEAFDIVPALHELINRLITPVPGAPAVPGSQPDYPNQQSLEIHQLAGEVSSVRARIRRARRVVEGLPDVDRTVDEQEAEMAELRDRIEKQQAVLRGLRSG